MKITDVKVETILIPMKKPFRIAFAVQDHSLNVLVKISTDEGLWGIGEAAPFEPVTGESAATVLEALNDLSRRCCADPIPLDELRREVAQITAEAPKPLLVYLGSALAAGSCALFFGGSMTDGLVAALFGLVICRLQRHFGPQCPNRLVFNLLSALAVGISITLCAFFLPELHADKILIGDIMLLIPGLAMTNAVRDTMVGSPISGAMRLIETLLWAGALAMGFMSAFLLMGGIGL